MDKLNRLQQLEAATPEVPPCFHRAMVDTLSGIAAQEAAQSRRHAGLRRSRRVLIFAVLLALLLGTAALAANHWRLFESISFMTGDAPKNADSVMQSELHRETVNNVEITVLEAGYDGRTLLIRYSYRMLDVDRCLGSFAPEFVDTPDYGTSGYYPEDMQLLSDHGVGWWVDQLWIDGRGVDMPANSGADVSGSAVPGELIRTEYWRLDNEDVALAGTVAVSLPIGERQSLADYRLSEHPEKYDADGHLLLPDKGIVTFPLNTADTLSRVITEHPSIPVHGTNVTAQCSEVSFTPLMTYITLTLEVDPGALDAYKAEHGEGYYAEDGKTLLWPYSGMDVFGEWLDSLALVDSTGAQLFPDVYGNNGTGDTWAEYVYPCLDPLPEKLFLAPIEGGQAQMEQAVRVR